MGFIKDRGVPGKLLARYLSGFVCLSVASAAPTVEEFRVYSSRGFGVKFGD